MVLAEADKQVEQGPLWPTVTWAAVGSIVGAVPVSAYYHPRLLLVYGFLFAGGFVVVRSKDFSNTAQNIVLKKLFENLPVIALFSGVCAIVIMSIWIVRHALELPNRPAMTIMWQITAVGSGCIMGSYLRVKRPSWRGIAEYISALRTKLGERHWAFPELIPIIAFFVCVSFVFGLSLCIEAKWVDILFLAPFSAFWLPGVRRILYINVDDVLTN